MGNVLTTGLQKKVSNLENSSEMTITENKKQLINRRDDLRQQLKFYEDLETKLKSEIIADEKDSQKVSQNLENLKNQKPGLSQIKKDIRVKEFELMKRVFNTAHVARRIGTLKSRIYRKLHHDKEKLSTLET